VTALILDVLTNLGNLEPAAQILNTSIRGFWRIKEGQSCIKSQTILSVGQHSSASRERVFLLKHFLCKVNGGPVIHTFQLLFLQLVKVSEYCAIFEPL